MNGTLWSVEQHKVKIQLVHSKTETYLATVELDQYSINIPADQNNK